jgi:hypothetical protein
VPFTLAHPAAILPLRGLKYLRSVPLILGALVPDLPYFLPYGLKQRVPLPETHTFVGSLTSDLLIAYLALVGLFVLRAPLTALLTPRSRALCLKALAPFRDGPREWLLAPVSIVLGVWTHLAWDSFTHADGWMVEHIAWLASPVSIGPYTGQMSHVFQYLSSLFGLTVMAIWYRRLPTPPVNPERRSAPRSTVLPVLLLIMGGSGLIGAVQATRYFLDSEPFHPGIVYKTAAIFLTHALTWFAFLYLVGGTIATLERSHERVSREGL